MILTADKNIEYAVKGLLVRHQALGIRSIAPTVLVHPHHDPGCLQQGASFLHTLQNQYEHALVLFDREGCGRDSETREALEAEVETALAQSGWGERAAAIVLDPEIEAWVWSPSPHVEEALGWKGRTPSLRQWLRAQGFWEDGTAKPKRPKEALEAAVRVSRVARSSSIYQAIARKVTFDRCEDPAFRKLCAVAARWFPA